MFVVFVQVVTFFFLMAEILYSNLVFMESYFRETQLFSVNICRLGTYMGGFVSII